MEHGGWLNSIMVWSRDLHVFLTIVDVDRFRGSSGLGCHCEIQVSLKKER